MADVCSVRAGVLYAGGLGFTNRSCAPRCPAVPGRTGAPTASAVLTDTYAMFIPMQLRGPSEKGSQDFSRPAGQQQQQQGQGKYPTPPISHYTVVPQSL